MLRRMGVTQTPKAKARTKAMFDSRLDARWEKLIERARTPLKKKEPRHNAEKCRQKYYSDLPLSRTKAAANARRRHERLKNDPAYKMKRAARNAVARICRMVQCRRKPRTRTHVWLGCDYEQAQRHIAAQFRDGMSWENHGAIWEVDHKRPLASFDLTDPDQWMIALHFTNLQPLLVTENRIKSASWAA